MFAVVRTGGKQYRVAAGDKIAVEKLAGDAGDTITLGDVLLAGEGDQMADAAKTTVSAEIIAQAKSEKVLVFKKRRRHNYRRKNGHRQQMTLLRIVAVGDSKHVPNQADGAERQAAPQTETAPTTDATPLATNASAAPVVDTAAAPAAPKAVKAAPVKDAAAKAADTNTAAAKPAAKQAPADKPAADQ